VTMMRSHTRRSQTKTIAPSSNPAFIWQSYSFHLWRSGIVPPP
jgi:hypothetical protein